jgi:hypothetical protein
VKRIGAKQAKQREPGQMMLFSYGSRAISTLRKLPTSRPSTKTHPTQKTIGRCDHQSMNIRSVLFSREAETSVPHAFRMR